jgi:CheY-like chemotaxis protein
MVIHDELVLLDPISTSLRCGGQHVIALSHPLTAIHFLRASPIDLLLTDIDMRAISPWKKSLPKRDGVSQPVCFGV